MNITSRNRRQKLKNQHKNVNGKTGTAAIIESYGNKRQEAIKNIKNT